VTDVPHLDVLNLYYDRRWVYLRANSCVRGSFLFLNEWLTFIKY
jgi:hypothetical protein